MAVTGSSLASLNSSLNVADSADADVSLPSDDSDSPYVNPYDAVVAV